MSSSSPRKCFLKSSGKASLSSAIFFASGYFDGAAARRILGAAKAAGLKLRMHADQLTNSGGAALAAELRAVTADHLEQTEEDGIAAMKSAGVQPVLLPGSVYALGKTRYPRRAR